MSRSFNSRGAILASSVVLFFVSCGSPETTAGPKGCKEDSECGSQGFCGDGTCLLDSAAPSIVIAAPAANQLVSSAQLILAGSITDGLGSGVSAAKFSTDNSSFKTLALSGGAFEVQLDVPVVDYTPKRITIWSVDRLGNSTSAAVDIAVDRLPPAFSFSEPEETVFGLSDVGTTVTIAGIATDASGAVALTEISLDNGATWVAIASPSALAYDYVIPADTDGATFALQARSTDSAGNVSDPVSSTAIFSDTVAPALSLDRPVENSFFSSDHSDLIVSGTLTDSHLFSATASVDEGSPRDLPLEDGKFLLGISFIGVDYSSHTLKVTAVDTAGNSSTVSRSFYVDCKAPSVAITSPHANQLFSLAAPATFEVTGSVSDLELDRVTLQLDSSEPFWITPHLGGAISVFLTAEDEDRTEHTLTLEATDHGGNRSSMSVSYLVDRKAPSLSFDLQEGLLLNATSPNPTVAHGTASDSSFASLFLMLDSAPPQALERDGDSFSVSLPVPSGEDFRRHSLVLAATDSAGNSTELTRHYDVDVVPPVIAITRPSTSAQLPCGDLCTGEGVYNLASPSSVAFAGTVSDGSGIKAESLTGTIGASSFALTETGSDWASGAWSLPSSSDGEYFTIAVSAEDSSGNRSSATRLIYVDRIAPSATVLVPGQRLVGRTDALVKFSEPMSVSSVRGATALNGAPAGPSFTSVDGESFQFADPEDLSPYSLYSMTLAATAADLSGNQAPAASQEFLTENLPPPYQTPIASSVSSPKLALDRDGNPFVFYRDSSSNLLKLAYWNGVDEFLVSSLPVAGGVITSSARDLLVRDSINPDLSLRHVVRVVLEQTVIKGLQEFGEVRYAQSASPLQTWEGLAPGSAPDLIWSDPSALPMPASLLVFTTRGDCLNMNGGTCSGWRWDEAFGVQYLSYTDEEVYYKRATTDGWSDPILNHLAEPGLMNGLGMIASGRASYLEPPAIATPLAITSSPESRSITGLQQARRLWWDSSGALGSARVAWSETGSPTTWPRLYVACADDPHQAASWMKGPDLSPYANTSSSRAIIQIALAASGESAGLGIRTNADEVFFASLPNLCPSTPATWVGPFSQALDPAVAVRPDGSILKAFVSTGSGHSEMILLE